MTPSLAVETWIAVAVVLAATSAFVLLLIVVAPWRSVRQEPPLDDAVESRILLGEDPEVIEEEIEEEEKEEAEAEGEPAGPGPAA
ncbi:MAG TPA: hypothetical protein VMQ81_07140 [Acidimicrobiia bacterium]|nr:hypothetical protein [Acidimicrobiia bacterium]